MTLAGRTGSIRKSLRSATLTFLLFSLVYTVQQFYMPALYRNENVGWSWYLIVEFTVFMTAIVVIFNEKEKYQYGWLTFAISFSFLDVSIGVFHLWEIHQSTHRIGTLWMYIYQTALIILKIFSTLLFCRYLTELNTIAVCRAPKVYYRAAGSPIGFQNGQVIYIIPNPSSTAPYPYPATEEILNNSIQPPQFTDQTVCHTNYFSSPPPEYSQTAN